MWQLHVQLHMNNWTLSNPIDWLIYDYEALDSCSFCIIPKSDSSCGCSFTHVRTLEARVDRRGATTAGKPTLSLYSISSYHPMNAFHDTSHVKDVTICEELKLKGNWIWFLNRPLKFLTMISKSYWNCDLSTLDVVRGTRPNGEAT